MNVFRACDINRPCSGASAKRYMHAGPHKMNTEAFTGLENAIHHLPEHHFCFRVWLITSVPGYHKGDMLNAFGHLKLSSVS